MKSRRLFYLIALVSTALFASLHLFDSVIIREQIESKTYDLRLRIRNFIKNELPPEDVIIVTVDEKSIKEIGRWPWSRDVMADLVNKISEGTPKVIGIDIMFSERESKKTDNKLADVFKKAGNVVLATAFITTEDKMVSETPKEVPDSLWDSAFMEVKSQEGIQWKKWAVKPESVNPPIEEFSKAASLGHVYTHPDMDAVLRWEFMYVNFGDDCYPSFPLQTARIALGFGMNDMILYGGSGIKLGSRFIPTDLSGRILINYRGKEETFRYIPASDIIKGNIHPKYFQNKIVLLGTSALATYDQKVTPLSANMPGVEKNASIVKSILLDNYLRKSPGVVELTIIIITGILLGFFIPNLKAIPGTILASASIILYIILSVYLLAYQNLWINLIYPVSNMFVIVITQTVISFFQEEKKAREIRKMFSSYVSPQIVAELINHPEKAKLGGERRTVTVMFSDLIGFTSLSEKLPPEEVVSRLNEYFKEMVDIIFKWNGTLDKLVGDEIMAFWGAPLEQPDHAELAVRCALNMSDRLNEIQEEWRRKKQDVLDCGIGINTGEVLIGNIGAPGKKMDYTIIGDHVNLTARVEKLTRQYDTRILITEDTVVGIESAIKSDLIGHIELKEPISTTVKGKEKAIKLFQLRGLKHHH
ncbi:MAG: adenylate/guanylate cyclase domain-containing protein [Nitrospirae bacterium]|nr:adenylate/guanylate cyclase domain-containing protein [Nitrospirota bacterium]